MHNPPPNEATPWTPVEVTPLPPHWAPLQSSTSCRYRQAFDATREAFSLVTRVSLLLVAALVGGLAGHYASTSNSGPGMTIDAVTTNPARAIPGGMSIPKLINKALPSLCHRREG